MVIVVFVDSDPVGIVVFADSDPVRTGGRDPRHRVPKDFVPGGDAAEVRFEYPGPVAGFRTGWEWTCLPASWFPPASWPSSASSSPFESSMIGSCPDGPPTHLLSSSGTMDSSANESLGARELLGFLQRFLCHGESSKCICVAGSRSREPRPCSAAPSKAWSATLHDVSYLLHERLGSCQLLSLLQLLFGHLESLHQHIPPAWAARVKPRVQSRTRRNDP